MWAEIISSMQICCYLTLNEVNAKKDNLNTGVSLLWY